MNPDTLQMVLFLIQLALLIAFFVLVADVRAIKKKLKANSYTKKTDLTKDLEKAKFMDNKDEIVSILKDMAYSEVNYPLQSIKTEFLKNLEEIAGEIKNYGGEIPSGLNEKITELQGQVNKK
jgi:predicted Holliday junction resolvase-like endonuclease